MEVHHHAHSSRKKWTHYLWEFIMLFLAVFCGFLAENQREHLVEHRREKQFVRSMMDDVSLDTAALHNILERRMVRKQMFDSLSYLLNSPERDRYSDRLYFFARHIQRLSTIVFTYNDRTIQQLKNGGNMRLIKNGISADEIVRYDAAVRDMHTTQQRENEYMMICLGLEYKIFDGRVMDQMIDSAGAISPPPPGARFLPTTGSALSDFNGAIHSLKTSNLVLMTRIRSLIAAAETLLATLKKEYHLK